MSSPATYEPSPPPNPWSAAADELDPPPTPDDPAWAASCTTWATGVARPNQRIPDGDWLIWLILAGRGFGKTRTGAETVKQWALKGPGHRFALLGQTFTDARDVMVEGEAGILHALPPSAFRYGSREAAWNRSLGELFFANGAKAKVFSAEKPGQLRGPEHDKAWVDEPAKFADARAGDAIDTAWNNLMLGLRSKKGKPQVVVTGTPTSCRLIRQLAAHPNAHVTRGSTYDNLDNLAPSFRAEILSRYEGTRLGRQELQGEILEDVEGALWTLDLIDHGRIPAPPAPLSRVVVAVDPAGGSSELNDETGIVVAGADHGTGYVLADRSGRFTPDGWAKAAIAAYHEYAADRIVAETNYGGDMVVGTLRAAGFKGHVVKVTASRGKRQRAEPVAALYEQGRVHHVGSFPDLEDQMCMWCPDSGESPDRMDALVWAFTDLLCGTPAASAFFRSLADEQARPPEDVPPDPSGFLAQMGISSRT